MRRFLVMAFVVCCAALVHAQSGTGGSVVGKPSEASISGRFTSPVTVRDVFDVVRGGRVLGQAMVMSVRGEAAVLVPMSSLRVAARAGDTLVFARHAVVPVAAVPTRASPSNPRETPPQSGQPVPPGYGPQAGPPPGQPQAGGSQGVSSTAPVLDASIIEATRDATRGDRLRVIARLRNTSARELREVQAHLVFWDEGQGTRISTATGQPVGTNAYSKYTTAVGTLQPGESRECRFETEIMSPQTIDTSARIVVLDVSRAFDPFKVRRLRWDFDAEYR